MVCSLRIGDRITIIETKQGSVRAVPKLPSGSERDHGYVFDSHRKPLVVASDSRSDTMEKCNSAHPIDRACLGGRSGSTG